MFFFRIKRTTENFRGTKFRSKKYSTRKKEGFFLQIRVEVKLKIPKGKQPYRMPHWTSKGKRNLWYNGKHYDFKMYQNSRPSLNWIPKKKWNKNYKKPGLKELKKNKMAEEEEE